MLLRNFAAAAKLNNISAAKASCWILFSIYMPWKEPTESINSITRLAVIREQFIHYAAAVLIDNTHLLIIKNDLQSVFFFCYLGLKAVEFRVFWFSGVQNALLSFNAF